MPTIFGCYSKDYDCKITGKVLGEKIDPARGKIADFYTSSNICLGVQERHDRGHRTWTFNDQEHMTSVFLSDLPKQATYELNECLRKSYAEKEAEGLLEALIRTHCDDFLFVLYDETKKRVFFADDSFGVRKLFYTLTPRGLLFSSSLSHLVRTERDVSNSSVVFNDTRLDKDVLLAYLLHGSVPPGRTIFGMSRKTLPGSLVSVDDEGNITQKPFWASFLKQTGHSDISLEHDYAAIFDAVKKRIDKKLTNGILLSGGLDSGIIASMLSRVVERNRIVALNLSYEGYYDESLGAQEVANFLGLRLVKKNVSQDEDYLLQIFKESISLMEEPSARTSFMSRYIALKAIREYADSVWLGEGGDEVFAGYTPITWKYDESRQIRFLSILPSTVLNGIANAVAFAKPDFRFADVIRYANLAKPNRLLLKIVAESTAASKTVQSICGFKIESKNILEACYYSPLRVSLEELPNLDKVSKESLLMLSALAGTDIMVDESYSSRTGLALKLPFLDEVLVKRFLNKPADEKISGKVTKCNIRNMASTFNLLPTAVITNRKSWFLNPTCFLEGQQFREHVKETASLLADSTESGLLRKIVSEVQSKSSRARNINYFNMLTLMEFLTHYV